MTKCKYFKVETKPIRSKEMRADRQRPAPIVVEIPYCSHPNHSPFNLKTAKTTICGPRLQCEGDLDNCPLTKDEFNDA